MRPSFAIKWMADFESFQTALDESPSASYMGDLTRSLSLVLDNFYAKLSTVAVSAETGEGIPEFLDAVQKARVQYATQYKPLCEQIIKKRHDEKMDDGEADTQIPSFTQ